MSDHTTVDLSLDPLMAQVCRVHHVRVHQALTELGLYRGQPAMLFALWRNDGMTHGELADTMHVQPATVSRMVQRMEKSGFVRRETDPDDQRVSRVFLSQAGWDIRQPVRLALKGSETDMLQGFSAQEEETLVALLTRVRDNLITATGDDSVLHRPDPNKPVK